MTSRDFCFWLQGYLEIRGTDGPIEESQVKIIQQHLSLVFKHEIDPSMGPPSHQAALDAIHAPPKAPPTIETKVHYDPTPTHGPGGPLLRC